MQQLNAETLKQLLREGVEDAQDRQIERDADHVFAGRMAARLTWALARIKQLETRAAEQSWEGYVDRQSGAFSPEEIAYRNEWR